jgi:hypothetical protein
LGRLFRLIKTLGQLVAVWQCYLRLTNVQSCYATLEYRLRNVRSNKFGNFSQPTFQTFGFLHISPACTAQTCGNRSSPTIEVQQPGELRHKRDSIL